MVQAWKWKKPETVFFGERGAFETSCPLFLSTIVFNRQKRGPVTVGPNIKRDCGTKQHKKAQTGTNFCAGTNYEGGSAIAPFSLFVNSLTAIAIGGHDHQLFDKLL